MNTKKTLLLAVILVVVISSLGMVSAGWFGSDDVETSSFKFECPDGYNQVDYATTFSNTALPIGDPLYLNGTNDSKIMVAEISKEMYDNLSAKEYKNTSSDDLPAEWSGTALAMGDKVKMDETEGPMRIVSQTSSLGTETLGITEIDGKYYSVEIAHTLEYIDPKEDADLIKNIFSSLEAK